VPALARAPAFSAAAASLGEVLRNRGIRRIEISWTTGTAADWALLVALLVVAYDAGGAVAAGLLGAVRVLPAIVLTPFSTPLVERFRGDRVLMGINLVRSAGSVLIAIVVGSEAPVEVTFVLAAVVAGAGSLVRPIQTALLPALARTPSELVAANVASSTGEAVGTFVGPLLAGILVATTGSVTTSLLIAATFAAAAAAVTGVRFEQATDAWAGKADRATRFRLRDVPSALRPYPSVALVVCGFVAQVFVRGLLITFVVVASIELLGLGDTGVGLLNAAIGIGGLIGALGALGLGSRSRLGSVFVLALAFWGLPLVLIGAWPAAALALAALVVTGISNAVLDVSGFTLVQRGVRNEDRVTIFGAMESLFGVALLAGSLLAPVLLSVIGIRAALVVTGLALPILALVTWRPITTWARRTTGIEEQIALLRRNPLFAPLPLTALDRLAETMRPASYAPGQVLMRMGEIGDRYVLIVDGEVGVEDEHRQLRICGPTEGVGEIALLRRVPRTATVTARTPVEAFEIDAATFLAAVAGPAASVAAEELASARLERSEAAIDAATERPVER
jgi:predicted MFS family arabinose efflux permease